MKMTRLKELHKSMISINADMQQFQVTTGSAGFDCLFSVRETPFILALTSRGEAPKFFKFEVTNGYWIKPFFDGFYYELAEALKSGANTRIRLEPKKFLDQLNSKIPGSAKIKNVPSPKEIVRLRADITEERDKPYFDTWIYWKSEGRKGPTKENLKKTKMILGPEALQYSISMRASTRWSSVDLNKDWKIKK